MRYRLRMSKLNENKVISAGKFHCEKKKAQ